MNKKIYKIINIAANLLIFLLMVVAVIVMIYVRESGALQESSWSALKYFTVLSNIFAGLTALMSAIYLFIDRKSILLNVLKFASTVSVALTFLTVILFLGPIYGYGLMYQNANLFMHLIVPVLAILQLLLLEERDENLNFITNFYAVVPMIAYGIFYMTNVIYHGGYGDINYDWYQFAAKGLGLGLVSFLVMAIVTFLISLLLYLGYKKINLTKNISE